ncbi:mechanosensitive ion channel domain-containing protein [uncultured Prevotella sp.]|uniref:mechanosensitive ion channel family protein n=1 Tax=uncultured Prevotella sp. TaxID=159272 RepID=UPI00262E7D43|nr:mechanosensitive ion channel domain-containing protein [uncultured Prevotella sp.]
MKKRLFIFYLLMFLFALPSQAVLKEKDLNNTLSILRNELTQTHQEQKRMQIKFKNSSDKVKKNLFAILSKSNQNALMLYSQKLDYVFDLAYACHEATDQFRDFKENSLPFRSYVTKINGEVARYDSLVGSLQSMPTMTLSPKAKIDRNVCLTLAVSIRNNLLESKNMLQDYIKYYDMTEHRLKYLNDYANSRYSEIQNNIFKNVGENYFSILSNLGTQVNKTAETVNDKYHTSKKLHSQWDSRMIVGLFLSIVFYGIISILLNLLAIRYLMPRKLRTEQFLLKRPCIMMATSTVTFAIIIGIIRNAVNQNFIVMASNLLVEYAWLLGVILISLLLRVDGKQIKSAFRIYSPLTLVGFIVITFRIALVPNDLVNLIFPPILLLCTIWQWSVISRHNENIPRSDMFFTYISLVVFVASTICSWIGYTLLSVQILIWWIMQLTCILTINCLAEWLAKYAAKHHIEEKPINRIWIYNLILKVGLPIMGVSSILISVYWAADVFNLTELVVRLFNARFIDVSNFSVSISSIVMVLVLWFIFAYISNTTIAFMQLHFNKKDSRTAASRNVMGKNVIQVLVWGIWLLISLAILHVSNTWLVVVSGGLSTGVGFASKDILENIYYGISLMAGRINIGDWIECDGTRGRVSSISYTSTMIEATDGSVIAFQNSQLFTKNYKNLTRNHGFELSVVNFGVGYGTNVERMRKVIIAAVEALNIPYIDKEKPLSVLFTEFGDNSINFKFICWVDVTKQVVTESQISECIYNTLNENDIEMPFPKRDVYIKEMAK